MSAFIDRFRRQIYSLTGHEVVTEKKRFERANTILVHGCVLFTDVFLTEVKKSVGNEQEEIVEKFLEKVTSMISSVFREALLPAIPGEEFSVSGFAIRLQQNLKKHITTLKLAECRVMHSFSVEPVGNGMLEIHSGFAVDAPDRNEIPIFDFKISNFDEVESNLIDSNGKTHADLLRLDTIEDINLFMKEGMYAQA